MLSSSSIIYLLDSQHSKTWKTWHISSYEVSSSIEMTSRLQWLNLNDLLLDSDSQRTSETRVTTYNDDDLCLDLVSFFIPSFLSSCLSLYRLTLFLIPLSLALHPSTFLPFYSVSPIPSLFFLIVTFYFISFFFPSTSSLYCVSSCCSCII